MGNIYEELKEEGRQEARIQIMKLWTYLDDRGMKDVQMKMVKNPSIIPELCEKYGITVNDDPV